MNHIDSSQLEWQKMNNLIPAIIQNAETGTVLMLGYMDRQALEITQVTHKLTLYSRDKNRILREGENTGISVDVVSIAVGCDGDSLLIQVVPNGLICHLGFPTCFQPNLTAKISFLAHLADLIQTCSEQSEEVSYTTQLISSGNERCAQKVGEESIETILAAVKGDKEAIIQETSDLVFHVLILLTACGLTLYDIIDCLQQRHIPVEKIEPGL